MRRTGLVMALAGALLIMNAGLAIRAEGAANDKARRAKLVGTWRIVSAKFGGKTSDLPQTDTTYKHVTPGGFTWLSVRKGTDKVYRMAGGTWKLQGNTYTEKIEYGMGEDHDVVR